jgi:hypothetical protein
MTAPNIAGEWFATGPRIVYRLSNSLSSGAVARLKERVWVWVPTLGFSSVFKYDIPIDDDFCPFKRLEPIHSHSCRFEGANASPRSLLPARNGDAMTSDASPVLRRSLSLYNYLESGRLPLRVLNVDLAFRIPMFKHPTRIRSYPTFNLVIQP